MSKRKSPARKNKRFEAPPWLAYLQQTKEVKRARALFLNKIHGVAVKHWHGFLVASRLAVKKNQENPDFLQIFADLVKYLVDWFASIDWNKWLPTLLEVAKIVIPILVFLIL